MNPIIDNDGNKRWYLKGLFQGSIKNLPLYLGLGCDEYIS